jgi:hypothetical protein
MPYRRIDEIESRLRKLMHLLRQHEQEHPSPTVSEMVRLCEEAFIETQVLPDDVDRVIRGADARNCRDTH